MKMKDIGDKSSKVALLVHPMLADAEAVESLVASRMGDGWRFLIPDLSGHGTASDHSFTETAKEADDIHTYLQEEGITHLDFVWGASLGAAVALALMRYVDASFGDMVLDGTPYMKAGKLITNMICMKMKKKHRKAMQDRELTMRKMTGLYGEAGPYMAEEMMRIGEKSLESVIRSCGSAVYPVLNDEQQKHTTFLYGEKDYNLKAALKAIPEQYPLSDLKVLPGYGHCGMIGKEPDSYMKLVLSCIR